MAHGRRPLTTAKRSSSRFYRRVLQLGPGSDVSRELTPKNYKV